MLAWGLAVVMLGGLTAVAAAQEQEAAPEAAGSQAPRRIMASHPGRPGWKVPAPMEGAIFLGPEHAKAFVAELAQVSGLSEEQINELLQKAQQRQREAFEARMQERRAQMEARMQERISQRLQALKDSGRLSEEQYEQLSKAVAEKDWDTVRELVREWKLLPRWRDRASFGPGRWGKHHRH